MDYFYPLIAAVIAWIVGYSLEGRGQTPKERFYVAIKWLGIVVVILYALVLAFVFTDGIGDIPILGGGLVWVNGHWTRGHWRRR